MINLSDLKSKDIRKSIDIDINGEIQEIVIFDISSEYKEKLKGKIQELSEKNLERDVFLSELLTDVFIECTNIAIDEDVIEVLNNPSGDLLIVLQELLSIIHDIEIEVCLETYQQLCQFESMEYAKLNLLKAEHVQLITGECKKVEGEIEKFKKNIKNIEK